MGYASEKIQNRTDIYCLPIFLLLCFGLICYGYMVTPNDSSINELRSLSLYDAIFIFAYNTIYCLVLLLLAFTGIPLLVIARFIINVGIVGKQSGVPFWIFYSSSFLHLILELYVTYIIITISIRGIYLILTYSDNNSSFKLFLIKILKRKIPLLIIILFISALIEVGISNKVYLYMVKNFM